VPGVRQDRADMGFWREANEVIGCGPRLLADGRIAVDPASEGFSSDKILSASSSRSMVGVTRDGRLLLATSSGTVRQMADVMKALGAWDAMNLDGGASSGLWVQGRYLTTPGRQIGNALLIVP
ncbi:MAG: phosphodiester glycosidase family protein, partial [Acidobacteriota bacterium]|nr:phosphodiester glycosidase family protein [Acidobacteriota bacterium]